MTALSTLPNLRSLDPVFAWQPSRAGLVRLALGAAGVVLAWQARQPLGALVELIKDREAVLRLADGLGIWGPVLLGATIALQVTVAVLPGHVLMLAGGYLYGFAGGAVTTWVSIVAASQLNFTLARGAGRPLVYRLAPARLIERWEVAAQGKTFLFFIMVLVLPIFPSDLMCYVAGFSKISPRQFLAANLLGHLPCAIVMSLVGAGALSVPPSMWVWGLALCAVALVLWRRYGARLEARFFPQEA